MQAVGKGLCKCTMSTVCEMPHALSAYVMCMGELLDLSVVHTIETTCMEYQGVGTQELQASLHVCMATHIQDIQYNKGACTCLQCRLVCTEVSIALECSAVYW